MGRFQSGQMGQTVNLLSTTSEVRILLSPLRGSSSFGRATAFQAVGSGFETRLPLPGLCSSGVEHFLGKEGVISSILIKGSFIILSNY
jgi:hypothetical protein